MGKFFEVMGNLLEQAKSIPHGIQSIREWLGAGGVAVDNATAQERADICIKCDKNVHGNPITTAAALAVRRHLEIKNKIGLRVNGEKSLGQCDVCHCVLRLLIHEPQENVKSQMTADEISNTPKHCWKLKP